MTNDREEGSITIEGKKLDIQSQDFFSPHSKIKKRWSNRDFHNEKSNLQIKELGWRIGARRNYGRALMWLLWLQNIFVFFLIGHAYSHNILKDSALALSILISGTLVQTAYIVRIIVTELFKDINYKDYDHKSGK